MHSGREVDIVNAAEPFYMVLRMVDLEKFLQMYVLYPKMSDAKQGIIGAMHEKKASPYLQIIEDR